MSTTAKRVAALDVLRGTAVAGMIVVTSPGDWNDAYPLLRHATWNGWTLADMVFPMFLFAVGMALGLAFPRALAEPGALARLWWRVGRRAAILIVLGLIVNATFNADILGIPVYIGHPGMDFLRIPGVLQRIALCYVAATALILVSGRKTAAGTVDVNPRAIAAAIAGILILYWLLMRFVPVPGFGIGRLDQEGNLAAYLDRAIFTTAHLWPLGSVNWGGPVVFDPEGLLATLPATTNTLFGVLAAVAWRRMEDRAVPRFVLLGALLMGAGLAFDAVFPINKLIWTSSFALLSAGFSYLTLAVLAWMLRSRRFERLCAPLRILGCNAILAFLLSIVFTKLGGAPWFRLDGATVTAQGWGDGIARQLLPDVHLAATACAFGVLAIITLMLWPLHRRALHIRL
jgi:predicted acyltransferase